MTTTAPKKPQDRKPKAAPTPGSYTVEVRGKEFTVESAALDDFELLDDLAQVEEGKGQRFPSLLKRLLGDQYRDALNLLRDEETGRVPVEEGALLVKEILEAIDPS